MIALTALTIRRRQLRSIAGSAMELRHLRYAIAAAEYGSFRRAARALGVPQSSVSRRIRDLEDEIGVSLFVRHHTGVNLTNAGERLLPRLSSALGEIAYATRDAGSAGRGSDGEIYLGISSSLASGFLRLWTRCLFIARTKLWLRGRWLTGRPSGICRIALRHVANPSGDRT